MRSARKGERDNCDVLDPYFFSWACSRYKVMIYQVSINTSFEQDVVVPSKGLQQNNILTTLAVGCPGPTNE